jgi:uncharacterized protein YkwD
MIRPLLAIFLLVTPIAFRPLPAVRAEEPKDKQPPRQPREQPLDLKAYEKALFDLVNKERAKAKLSPLTINDKLTRAARRHTDNMAGQEKMSHVLDGKGPADRAKEAGYDYRKVSENLARAASEDPDTPVPSAEEIHKSWMASKKHRANILEAKFREVGLSVGRSKKGTYFYTMVFGVRTRQAGGPP